MKIGRNAPCPCGSGKKYKKCCMNKEKVSTDLLWRRLTDAHDRLAKQLLVYTRDRLGEDILFEAMNEFLGWPEEDEDVEDSLDNHMQVFFPWFYYNWTFEPADFDLGDDLPPFTTVAGAYSEHAGASLDPLQERLIEAASGQPFSFYEITECARGKWLRLKDIFLGGEKHVIEKQGSQQGKLGDILFGQIVEVDQVAILVGCGSVIIPPRMKPTIVRLRDTMIEEEGPLDLEILDELDMEIRALYFAIYRSLFRPPKLCNTDGDPLLFHTLHFRIDDPEMAFQSLSALCVMEDEDSLRQGATLDSRGKVVKVEIAWNRPGFKNNEALDNTVLGQIEIDHDKLTVRVNSRERAATIRRKIEGRLGKGVRYLTTEIQSPEGMMATRGQGQSPGEGPGGMSREELMALPEVREQISKMLNAHWENWPDQEMPALGNITPREAVKTRGGRESVEALLLEAERFAAADKTMGEFSLPAIQEVRRRLGLD